MTLRESRTGGRPVDNELRLSAGRLENILQSVNGIVWEADADPFRFTFVNKKAESILGYPIEKWLANPEFWSEHIHPADRELAVELCATAARRGEDHQLEYRMITADDRIVWFRDEITVSMGDDGIVRMCGLMVDITDRIAAIDEIRSSEARMRLVLDQVPARVWTTDLDLRFTQVTGKVFHGDSPSIGMSVNEFFQTDDPEFVVIKGHKLALQGEPQFYDLDFRDRHFEVKVEPLRNYVKEIVGCVGVAHDVTERKIAAENILKEKQFTEALLDNLPGAFIQYDLSGKRLRWNKYIEEKSGYSADELVGMPLFKNVVDAQRPQLQKAFADLLSGGRTAFEFEIAMKDGTVSPYFVTATRVEIGGSKSIIGIGIDITALKQAEEALRESRRELLEAQRIAKLGSWTWDIASDVVTWSEELYLQRGLDPCQPAPGLEDQKRFHTPESWERLRAAVAEAVEHGTPYKIEVELVLPDEGKKWFVCRGEAIRDEDGKIIKLRGTEQDINELKQTTEMLRLSEERFHKAFNANPDPITIQRHSDGAILAVNERWTEVFGFSAEEAINLDWRVRKQTQPDDRERLKRTLDEQGSVRDYYMKIGTKSGDVRHVSISSEPIVIDDQRCNIFLLRDLTDQRIAEVSLRESERRYRETMINLKMIALVTNDSGSIKFCNDFTAQITGWHSEKLIGAKWTDVFAPSEPAELLPEWPFPPHFEGKFRTARGEERSIKWTNTELRDLDGNVIGLAMLGDDITERINAEKALRLSEERYRDLVENSIDIIYAHDLEGKFTSINRAAERITGYTREEILGLNIAQVVAPEHIEKVASVIDETVAGKGSDTLSIEILTKDKRRLSVEITYSLMTHNGVPVGIRGAARDVTAQLQLEQKLRQAQRLESIGRLAGGVAHDFNNMLQAINGYSSLVLRQLSDGDPLKPFVEEIKNAGERSASLTQQLLAFSRKQIMQPRVIDVNSIILHLEKMLRRLIGEDVTLKTDLTPLVGNILADPSQIEQVIVNLVVNARDAMPNGGKVLIKTSVVNIDSANAADQQLSKEGPYVVISVTDNGVGILEEARSHIFEPFFTTRETGKGTGLGLSTVYGIVKQSDGFIELDTEPGEGTTFRVFLPVVEAEAERYISSFEGEIEPPVSETLLLIEDEEVVRAVIKELLQSLGYRVFVAATPAEAIETCREHDGAIDMVVADVIMPEMSGPELAKKLLEMRPAMKVLYVSGYADTALDHHGILAPDINFLQKPFTHEAIAQKIRDIFDSK